MRRLLVPAILLWGAACGPAPVDDQANPLPSTTSDSIELSFRTWNVENFPLDGRSLGRVSEIIRTLPADLIAIQEIKRPDEFWLLADQMPDYEGLRAEPGYYTGVGLLYRPKNLRLLSTRSLFTDDDFAFPRPALLATFEIAGTDLLVRVVVVHLKARLDAESQSRRRDAIAKIGTWAERAGYDQEPLLILGDFNDEVTDAAPDNVYPPLLDDPDFRFLTKPLEESGAFSYIDYQVMIDHIVASSATFDVFDEVTTEVLPLDRGWPDYQTSVSDHLPVETVLRVR